MMRVRSMLPSVTEDDVAAVAKALREGWGDRRNESIDELEEIMCAISGKQHSIAVSHGTAGLQLALETLSVGPGDEVIVPDLTWVASASPLVHIGATPVFVDVDDSMCLTAQAIESAITPATKAIVAVDLMGSSPEWSEVLDIAGQRRLPVIEDATEGIGGSYRGAPLGSFGDISVFSLNATKVVTSGQGGVVSTNNPNFARELRLRMHHGIDHATSGKYYWSTQIGHNFQIANFQAALGVSQLRRIGQLIEFKTELRGWYEKHFAELPIRLIPMPNGVRSNYWINVAVYEPGCSHPKEKLVEFMASKGVDVRPFFYRLSDMEPFRESRVAYDKERRNGSRELSEFGFCLPYGYDMSELKVALVAETLADFLEESSCM